MERVAYYRLPYSYVFPPQTPNSLSRRAAAAGSVPDPCRRMNESSEAVGSVAVAVSVGLSPQCIYVCITFIHSSNTTGHVIRGAALHPM